MLATVLKQQGALDEAITHFQRAINSSRQWRKGN